MTAFRSFCCHRDLQNAKWRSSEVFAVTETSSKCQVAVFRNFCGCWDLFEALGGGLQEFLLLLGPLQNTRWWSSEAFSIVGTSLKRQVGVFRSVFCCWDLFKMPGDGLRKLLFLLEPIEAPGWSLQSIFCYWGLFKMSGGGLKKCLLLLGPLQNAGWQSSEVFLFLGPLRSARLQSSEVFSVTVSSSKCRVAVFGSVFYC